MNLEEIKQILEKEKGKIVIVENGEPTMVISPFDNKKKNKPNPVPQELTEDELKIEDLPF